MKERAQSLLVPPAAPGYRQPVTLVMSSPNLSSGSSSWLPAGPELWGRSINPSATPCHVPGHAHNRGTRLTCRLYIVRGMPTRTRWIQSGGCSITTLLLEGAGMCREYGPFDEDSRGEEGCLPLQHVTSHTQLACSACRGPRARDPAEDSETHFSMIESKSRSVSHATRTIYAPSARLCIQFAWVTDLWWGRGWCWRTGTA